MEKRSFIKIISEFSKTQSRLCKAVTGEYDLQDDMSVVFRTPTSGSLELDGEMWEYKRHGLGLRFINKQNGQVIDAHRNIVSNPDGIDAWRLTQYFEAIETSQLGISIQDSNLKDEKKIKELLSRLDTEGIIVQVTNVSGLYVIV